MSVNIGHGDERVIQAIHEQAQTLAYANPFMATEPRARLGAKLAEITPGDIDTFLLHQRRRRSQRERDQDWRASLPDGTRSWRATARITARPRARSR